MSPGLGIGVGLPLLQGVGVPPPPIVGYALTFDYNPSRDGLALATGGPTSAGYAASRAANPRLKWEPRQSSQSAFSGFQSTNQGQNNSGLGQYEWHADPEYAWPGGYTPFALVSGALRIRAQTAASFSSALAAAVPNDPVAGTPLPWVSGILTSYGAFSQKGGYFEFTAKFSAGKAVWPAFWLYDILSNIPEIDVMEQFGGSPGETTDEYHTNAIGTGFDTDSSAYSTGKDLSAAFHKYAVDVHPSRLDYYFDGSLIVSKDTSGRPEMAQGTLFMLMAMQIGSRVASFVPAPDGTTPNPSDLTVQSVRVWQQPPSAPVNSAVPAITGTAQQGQVVTASLGKWDGSPIPTFAYQWKRAGSAISGATSAAYTLVSGDVGQSITCTVTATNSQGAASATSAVITPISALTATTLDPTEATASNVLSNGNKTVSGASNPGQIIRSILNETTGKFECLFTITAVGSGLYIGLADTTAALNAAGFNGMANVALLAGANSADGNVYNGTSFATIGNIGASFTTGDAIRMCVDISGKKVWFKKNTGNWNGSGTANPATGTGGYSLNAAMSHALHVAVGHQGGSASVTVDFDPTGKQTGFVGWDS